MIKIAVVGIGHVGYHHARILSTDPRVNLCAIADTDEQKASCAQQFNTTFYASYQQIPSSVDAVVIASPTSTHASIADYFLNINKHIFVEKAFTNDLPSAKNIVKLALEKKLILQVGLIEKYNPAFGYFNIYKNNPSYIEIHRTHPFINRCLDVDVIIDLMIHDLDLLCDIFPNSIEDIQASGNRQKTQFIDRAMARIKYSNNCICEITASRISERSMRKMNIFQNDGYYSLNFAEQSLTVCKPLLSPQNKTVTLETITHKKEKKELLPLELDTFIKAVQNNSSNIINSGTQALKSLELAFTIKEIIESRTWK